MPTSNENAFEGAPLTGRGAVLDAETYGPIAPEVVAIHRPSSLAAEHFRILRSRLETLADAGVRALGVTSAQGGEGKSTVAVNAALTLGRGGRRRVVLVDANLRRPRVHMLLGLRPREGLCDVLAGRATLGGTLWRFGTDELYVLPTGNLPEHRGDALYTLKLAPLFAELRERFDCVLVDLPAALGLADAPTLCRELDGALLVVRAGVTPRELVVAALGALVGVSVHGVVLNHAAPDALIATEPLPDGASTAAPLALPAPSA